jgi:hypothetical protein
VPSSEIVKAGIDQEARCRRRHDAGPARRALVAILSPFRPASRPPDPVLDTYRIAVHVDPGFADPTDQSQHQTGDRIRGGVGAGGTLSTN